MTIRVNENKDEAYYEEQASQEEIYLENVRKLARDSNLRDKHDS